MKSDIAALYGGGMCGEEEYEECKHTSANLEWQCSKCKKRRPGTIGQWTLHILSLRRLQQAGYPFKANDLDYEEWLDLGIVNETIDQIQRREALMLSTKMRMLS